MKDEIKEILDEMLWQFEKYPNDDFIIGNKESRILLDYITTLQKDLKIACEVIEKLKSDKKKAIEYLTSYEAIETIQQFDHSKNNEDLDNSTIDEMTRRYLEVHDKVLNTLQGDDNNGR